MGLLHLSAFCKMYGVKFVASVSRFAAKKYDVIIVVPVIATAAQHCMLLFVSAAYELGNSVCASVCLHSYCIVATVDQKGQRFEKVKSNFQAPWD